MPHGPTGGRSALPPKAVRRRGRGRRRSDERLHSAPPRGWTHLRPDLQQPGAFVVLDPFARGPTETYRLRLVYPAQFPCYVFPLGQEYELPRHKSRGGVRMRLRRVFSTPLSSASQDPSPPPSPFFFSTVSVVGGDGTDGDEGDFSENGFFFRACLFFCARLFFQTRVAVGIRGGRCAFARRAAGRRARHEPWSNFPGEEREGRTNRRIPAST